MLNIFFFYLKFGKLIFLLIVLNSDYSFLLLKRLFLKLYNLQKFFFGNTYLCILIQKVKNSYFLNIAMIL